MDLNKRAKAVNSSRTFKRILQTTGATSKKVLDIGCAYGEHLENFGEGSLGLSASTDEVNYIKAKGGRAELGNAEDLSSMKLNEKFDIVWANNILEHLLSPHSFIMNLREMINDKGVAIIGVPVFPRLHFLLRIKKFNGSLADAHVNFFTKETLRLTVERAGLQVNEIRPFITSNKYLDKIFNNFAPHLYLIAKNNKEFKYSDKKVNEWKSFDTYKNLLRMTNQ